MITIEKLVPESELRRINAGSFEERVESLQAPAIEYLREAFGTNDVILVATHSDHVVAHACGSFHKVALAESDSGKVYVTGVQPLHVETYEEASKFAAVEAEQVVDLFFQGAVDKAQERLAGLIPLVRTDQARDDAQRHAVVESTLNRERPWKSLFKERASHLKRFILDELSDLEEHRLQSKYRALYEGSIDESKLDGYAGLVEEDLETVLDRIEAVYETTSKAFDQARPALEDTDGDDAFPMYENFATDLINDLRAVHEAASQASFEIENVACRGKLRDTLAESVHNYEVASRFVVAVANRLTAEDR